MHCAVVVIRKFTMARHRLNIKTESRIRWKVYVRFGGEYLETGHDCMARRWVLSLHSDGNIINSFVNRGEGPEEFQVIRDFNVTSDNIILFDPRSDEPFIFLDRDLNFLSKDKIGRASCRERV